MKNILIVIGFIGIIALSMCSCNKKCTCTTTDVPDFDGTITYEQPNSKKACKAYEDSQNEAISSTDGHVACVYE